jgi:hypothetical protein
MIYVAVDIGKRRCVTCVMDQDGSILDTGSYPNTTSDASRYARQTVEKYGECKAVVESTGTYSNNGLQTECLPVVVYSVMPTGVSGSFIQDGTQEV